MTKTIYWIATGLLSALMLFSATMYFVNYEMVVDTFTRLGYPTYIIYPLGVAKILAVVAILSRKSEILKEWAYAGLFFDFVLALSAHLVAKDGEFILAFVAIILLLVSRYYDQKALELKNTDQRDELSVV